MKKNMSIVDRDIRGFLAVLMVGLYVLDVINGAYSTLFLIAGIMFTFTSLVRICPLYLPFGISTNKIDKSGFFKSAFTKKISKKKIKKTDQR